MAFGVTQGNLAEAGGFLLSMGEGSRRLKPFQNLFIINEGIYTVLQSNRFIRNNN